jgi:endonuclease/exonuclease/phosphatase family metal-dependent hydrolase
MGNDGGIYYIRQRDNDLVWFGELAGRFSNVFRGTVSSVGRAGAIVSGSWADVPKRETRGNATLRLQIRDAFTLTREGVTDGFGGTRWDRLPQVRRDVRLLSQNTYLMVGKYAGEKFAVEARTPPAIALTREYDIACLQEVMLEEPQKAFTGLTRINWDQTVSSANSNQLRETAQVIDSRTNSVSTRIMVGKIVRPSHPLSGRFYVLGPDSPGVKEDGGLLLISKFPITVVSAFVFSESRGTDRGANKGVIYAKVRLPRDKYIHIFNTHMQAGDPDDKTALGRLNSRQVRAIQLSELTRFINRLVPDIRNEHIVLMGDLNIIAPKPTDWGDRASVRPPANRRRPTNTRSAVPSSEYNGMLGILSFLRDSWVSRTGPGDLSPGFTYIGKDWRTAHPSPWGILGNTLAEEDETDPQRLDYILTTSLVNTTNIALVPDQSPRREPVFTFTGPIGLGLRRRTIPSNTIADHLGVEMTMQYPL